MDMLQTQGIAMPRLGLGTYRMRGADCRAGVESALELGYRHIDTAEMYGNEEAVGAAIAAAAMPRGEIHVTSKVWYENLEGDALRRAFDASLARLRLDVIDLYLVHWPAPGMDLPAILSTLMRLKEEGRIRALGVANFTVALLRRAIEEIGAPIACNQVEYHVHLGQEPLLRYQREKGVPLVAYCPMAQGRVNGDPALARIAAKHGASPAQVALKWLLEQDGVAAIPKAQSAARQQENLDARKLVLDGDDRHAIAALGKDQRLVDPSFGPRWDPPTG
ncbi:MAG: aldo/keto reductase [Sneathiellaceae bacterium]